MGTKEFRKQLFDRHLMNLKSLFPAAGNIFVCPVCQKQHTAEAIDSGRLTDGHVWPRYIRKKNSRILSQHRVLLCASCNHTLGSRGDKQMQLFEKMREGDREGVLYGERRVEIVRGPSHEPIPLRAKIHIDPKTLAGKISFKKRKGSPGWLTNDPTHMERFYALTGARERFSVLAFPPDEFRPVVAQIGWITSAYLFAFYTLGYWYVCHEELEPVRSLILRSFGKPKDQPVGFSPSAVLGVSIVDHCDADPEIAVVIPLTVGQPEFLQVRFLNYQVRLPFPGIPFIFYSMLKARIPDIQEKIASADQQGGVVCIAIMCNKSDGHLCTWDYVLGKPLHEAVL